MSARWVIASTVRNTELLPQRAPPQEYSCVSPPVAVHVSLTSRFIRDKVRRGGGGGTREIIGGTLSIMSSGSLTREFAKKLLPHSRKSSTAPGES